MTADDLKYRFEKLSSSDENRYFGLKDYSSSLCALIGFQHGMPTLLIAGKFVCTHLTSSEAITIKLQNSDDYSRIFFIESDSKYHDLFVNVCLDLLSVIEKILDPEKAYSSLLARFEAWKKFWKSSHDLFTREQTRGLAGELFYLENCLKKFPSSIEIIQSWQGPLGSEQDFIFRDRWVEIKTINPIGTEVTISSLEQLDPLNISKLIDEVPGYLVVIKLQDNPIKGGITLQDLDSKIRKLLKSDPYALQLYQNSLEMSGANVKNGKYETSLKFAITEITSYYINPHDFPILSRRNNIPDAVTKVKYNLSINAIKKWIVED